MAPSSFQDSGHSINQQGLEPVAEVVRSTKDEGRKMTLTRKLMMSSSLWGMEAGGNFEHLYTIPLLQTLGMPVSLMSSIGVVAGPASILLMPFMGWLTDRGSNPLRRRIIATIFAAGMLVLGMLCIVVANVLHLRYLTDYAAQIPTLSQLPPGNGSQDFSSANSTEGIFNGSGGVVDDSTVSDWQSIPLKALLCCLGCVCVDLGFDATNCFTKSLLLVLSPRSDHTSMLVIGVLMASAGGVSMTSQGIIDLVSLLGLSDVVEGGKLCIQTSLQAGSVILFVLVGQCITLLTIRSQLKDTNTDTNNHGDTEQTKLIPHVDDNASVRPDSERFTRSIISDTFENSIRSFGGGAVHFDPNLAMLEEYQTAFSAKQHQTLASEITPLLTEEDEEKGVGDGALYDIEEEFVQSTSTTGSMSYGTWRSETNISQLSISEHREKEEMQNGDAAEESGRHRSRCEHSFKTKIILIALASFFSVGQATTFSMGISDFVGKTIYGGDPQSPPGSESVARYQEGMRMAAWVLFAEYLSFLMICCVHSRLLAFLGCRLEFVAVQLLMSASALVTAMTTRLETVFVLGVVAGFHRACFYVVPFNIINDIVQSMASEKGDGKSKVGFAMSVMAISIPLSYCLIFVWVGPIEEVTGYATVSLWIITVCGCTSTTIFLFLGKV